MTWSWWWRSINQAIGDLIGIEDEGIEELRADKNVKILQYSKCNERLLNHFGLPNDFIESEYTCYMYKNKYYYFKFILDKMVIEEKYKIGEGSIVYSKLH